MRLSSSHLVLPRLRLPVPRDAASPCPCTFSSQATLLERYFSSDGLTQGSRRCEEPIAQHGTAPKLSSVREQSIGGSPLATSDAWHTPKDILHLSCLNEKALSLKCSKICRPWTLRPNLPVLLVLSTTAICTVTVSGRYGEHWTLCSTFSPYLTAEICLYIP